jgi:2-(1,2-epoxy-1,2-dihydrophenyl)acetyl-CoA isomerase
MSDKLVLCERDGAVAIITLNRPKAMNALNMEMGRALADLVEGVRFDRQVRSVVITGSGRAFSAGGDLKAMMANMDAGGDPSQFLRDLTKLLHPAIIDLRLMEKPVIAAVNGPAGGAGFSLALACDLRFMAESAFFQQAYTAVGLIPDGGMTLFLARMVGLGGASELFLLNPRVDARRALQIGLVHQVVPAEELEPHSMEIARELAAGPTVALGQAKQLLNRSMIAMLEGQLEAERQTIAAVAATADHREGLAAFLGKRQPVFEGK